MKLDFSTLAQPAAIARGQVGATGTPASTRVCASPLAQPGAGTAGDKPAAMVLAADRVVAAPAACPPLSPACPQEANTEKFNAGAVSPVPPLVPTEEARVAAVRFEREDLARFNARRNRLIRWRWPVADAERMAERLTLRDREADSRVSCTDCQHYQPGRCHNHRHAGLHGQDVGRDLASLLQRCPGFKAIADINTQRTEGVPS
jgi:hypothetical protein